jgi:hypothetical protein
MSETALCITGWKACLDRLDVHERIDMIDSILSRPIDVPGLRAALQAEYIELTEPKGVGDEG